MEQSVAVERPRFIEVVKGGWVGGYYSESEQAIKSKVRCYYCRLRESHDNLILCLFMLP